MATFSKIDGAEPSTVTFSLLSVTQDHGGVTKHQEVVTLGGSESTLSIAQVRASAPASTEWGLVVRVADPSTGPFVISSVVGPVTVRSSAANALVTAYQSSAADLNVTVAGYSTTAAVSSVSGRVATMPFSTVWASSAGFHFDSSGAMQVNVVAGSAASTVVTVNGNASSNSSLYLPVRLTNGTAFLSAGTDYADGSTASNLAGPVLTFDNGSNATMRAVSLTLGLPVNVVAGAAAGSTIVTVSTGSVRVHQSSAADLNVTVAGYSTTVNISSLAGPVIVRSSAANALFTAYQSSAADFNVTVAGYSTTVNVSSGVIRAQVYTSSGGAVEGSTTTPAHGVIGIHTRPVCSSLQSTTVLITSTHSTALYDLISSVAGVAHKVYGYFVSSTHTIPSTLVFMSSNSIDRFHVAFGSGSSGMTGANLAISPLGGAFLFRTDAANALRCRIEGTSSLASTVIARISLSFFTE